MSHFSVLVIGPDVEAKLAPFQENNMGDCPKQYLAFHEDKDCEVDEITGKNGYWENPNAKWDWYTVGGRWTGFFTLKSGAVGQVGSPGLMTREAKTGTADMLLKGDIDFDSMRHDAQIKAENTYDMAMRILVDLPENKTWAEVRHDHENDTEKARTAYWEQSRCKAWREEEKRVGYKNWPFGFDQSPDDFLISRERYIENARNRAGSTFAVLMNGKWYERGEMGWWGCVGKEKDEETWVSMFSKLMDSLPDDTQLTLVDCHI